MFGAPPPSLRDTEVDMPLSGLVSLAHSDWQKALERYFPCNALPPFPDIFISKFRQAVYGAAFAPVLSN
ncbi:hypothetical protein cyc_00744 [Cyclospora cayetanensis]|uniref:Uncharacterized protein n=1 Tax=Cyclospora cayetanensis TaxID=88456 RepID=A0A1D3CV03_9EIME|nr:hypothetical protein cyc_00744 [Cyclospora cayetanensis]